MSDTAGNPLDFEAFLGERGISVADYTALAEDKQRYLREIWHMEQHLLVNEVADTVEEVADTGAPESSPLPPAQPPAGIDQNVIWVALGGVALLVLCLLFLQLRPFGHADGTEGLPAPSVRPAPAVAPPAGPVVTAPIAAGTAGLSDWQEVGRVGGTGTKSTPAFTITGPKWRVIWMTRPGAGQKPQDFAITVRRASGETVGPAAHVKGESEGETVLRGTGAYRLEIASGQSFLVKVYDYR